MAAKQHLRANEDRPPARTTQQLTGRGQKHPVTFIQARVGFGNSSGLVFVDKSAEEVMATQAGSRLERRSVATAGTSTATQPGGYHSEDRRAGRGAARPNRRAGFTVRRLSRRGTGRLRVPENRPLQVSLLAALHAHDQVPELVAPVVRVPGRDRSLLMMRPRRSCRYWPLRAIPCRLRVSPSGRGASFLRDYCVDLRERRDNGRSPRFGGKLSLPPRRARTQAFDRRDVWRAS